MLVLKDLPWWLEHPENLARVVALAVQYQSEEPGYRGRIEWYGDEVRAEMAPDTTSATRDPGTLPVRDPDHYAKHPELMRFALEIEIAMCRQRSPDPPLRARDILDKARPRDDHAEDRGHGR